MAARTPEQLHAKFAERMNAGDMESLLDLYEPEAKMVPQPGQQAVSGTQAIRAALESFLALKPRIEVQTKYLIQVGDIVQLSARWRVTGTGPDGKTVQMQSTSAEVGRRQQDGTWRYVIDHPFGAE